jgi:hypothetical protein
MSDQSVTSDFPTVSARLNELARDVWRIGDGHRTNPEAIAIAKDDIAHRLAALAKELAA